MVNREYTILKENILSNYYRMLHDHQMYYIRYILHQIIKRHLLMSCILYQIGVDISSFGHLAQLMSVFNAVGELSSFSLSHHRS